MKLLAVAAAFVASVAAMPGNGYPGSGYPGEGSPGGGYPGGGGSPGEGYPGNGSPGEGYPGGGSPGEGYPGGDSPGGYPGGGYPEGPNHYPVPGGTRFQDATNVCKSGKVMCCNQATYRNDVDSGNSGLLGVLNNAGGGPGAGVFNQCDNININCKKPLSATDRACSHFLQPTISSTTTANPTLRAASRKTNKWVPPAMPPN